MIDQIITQNCTK